MVKQVGRSAASETNVVEGRVVDGDSSVRSDAGLNATDAIDTVAAVVSPVAAGVADAIDLAVIGAAEPDIVYSRVVGRVAIGADSQLEGDRVSAQNAALHILRSASAVIIL